MRKIFKSVSKFVAGAVLGGAMIFGGSASAADMNSEGMQLFTQALNETSKTDDRVFHNDLFFMMPGFIGDLELDGVTENDNFRGKGNFGIWMLDDEGNVTEPDTPFYLTQSGNNFTIYYQDDKKKWYKFKTPDAATSLADMVATPTAQDNEFLLNMVKEVNILQNSDERCTMLVKIDGNVLADMVKEESAKTAKVDNSDDELAASIQAQFDKYVDSGLRSSDVWYLWTVDKKNWQTLMVSANLSSILQSIAQAALNDDTQDWGMFRDMLETVAFYSECRLYTNYLKPSAKKQLEIPAKVLKAKEVDSLTAGKSKK